MTSCTLKGEKNHSMGYFRILVEGLSDVLYFEGEKITPWVIFESVECSSDLLHIKRGKNHVICCFRIQVEELNDVLYLERRKNHFIGYFQILVEGLSDLMRLERVKGTHENLVNLLRSWLWEMVGMKAG